MIAQEAKRQRKSIRLKDYDYSQAWAYLLPSARTIGNVCLGKLWMVE